MVTQRNGGGVVVLRQPTAVAVRVAGWVAALVLFYAGAWVTSRGVLWLTVDVLGRTITPLPPRELRRRRTASGSRSSSPKPCRCG